MSYVIVFIFTISTFLCANYAVLDFTGKNVSKSDTEMVTDIFKSDIVKNGNVVVVDRNNIKKILNEQNFQYSGCTDSDCAVEIGKLLNAKYIFIGSLMKLGNSYILIIELIDVETGKIINSEKEKSASLDGLLVASEVISKNILKKNNSSKNDSTSYNLNSHPVINGKTKYNFFTISKLQENYPNEFWASIPRIKQLMNANGFNYINNPNSDSFKTKYKVKTLQLKITYTYSAAIVKCILNVYDLETRLSIGEYIGKSPNLGWYSKTRGKDIDLAIDKAILLLEQSCDSSSAEFINDNKKLEDYDWSD